jgi:ketosteroid isomerase-like protein
MSTATARSGGTQELSMAYVREIFKNLESGDGKGFFDHVAEDVDCPASQMQSGDFPGGATNFPSAGPA